jgi:hypothetical protein
VPGTDLCLLQLASKPNCQPDVCVAHCFFCTLLLLQFDELQTCSDDDAPLRRPPCDSLLDVFMNIRDDEVEHVKTMHACQVCVLLGVGAACLGRFGQTQHGLVEEQHAEVYTHIADGLPDGFAT